MQQGRVTYARQGVVCNCTTLAMTRPVPSIQEVGSLSRSFAAVKTHEMAKQIGLLGNKQMKYAHHFVLVAMFFWPMLLKPYMNNEIHGEN